MYYVIEAYDMLYSDVREKVLKAWSEKFIYLCFDLTRKMIVTIVFSMKAKTQILNVFVKLKLFSFLNVVSN